MVRQLVATVALAAALSGQAVAQRAGGDPIAPAAPERHGDRQQAAGASPLVSPQRPGGPARFVAGQGAGEVRYNEIHRAVVVDRRGAEIGRVEGVILDREGRAVGAVVAVGGFLGVAEKSIAVPWRALRTARGARVAAPMTLTLDVTGDQLRSAPEYRPPERVQADRVVEASRQRMLDKQERGVLQRALQALDRADQALQLQDQEAARAALAQAREAVEQAIAAQEEQQQQPPPPAGPEPPAAGQARQP